MKLCDIVDFNRKIKDSPGDNGGKHVSFVIVNLTDSTDYTLTVLSGNSRANSSRSPDPVNFFTYGKPSTYTVFVLTDLISSGKLIPITRLAYSDNIFRLLYLFAVPLF